MQLLKEDTSTMAKKIELLEATERKLLGDGLESCSIHELHQLENQLEKSLGKIRARKEIKLLKENAKLREKSGMQPMLPRCSTYHQEDDMNESTEVETELFIWHPERRNIKKP
uniref:MADS22 n=1 Tax=Hippophae rhamnoides TaxID=193516 RepID=A0AAU7LJD1_9ROSA